MRFRRNLIRIAMTVASAPRALLPSSMRRPGVLGIALTSSGKVVLVRHSYMRGWHPPGGGRKRGEDGVAATLRELREEIGLTGWSSVERLPVPRETVAIFLLTDVAYRPVWSLEIDAVAEFAVDALPPDASPRLVRVLAGLGFDARTATG